MTQSPPPWLAAARLAVNMMFFVHGVAFANWLSRIPSVRDRLDLSEQQLGLMLLGTSAGAMVAFRVAGRLIARFGSARVTQVAAGAFCLFFQAPAYAPTVITATVGLLLLGAVSGLMDVGMNAQAVEVERLYNRPILASVHGVFSLGGLVGAMTGSAAAGAGLSPGHHLTAMGIMLFPAAVWAGARLVRDDNERTSTQGPAPVLNRALVALGIVAFCSSIGEGAMADWTAVYLRDELQTGLGTAALGYAAFSMAMLAGRFAGDRITAVFGAVRVVRAGGLIVAMGLGLGLAFNTVASMFAGVVCVGLGLSAVVPVVFRAGGSMAGVPRGAALATIATLSYTGFVVGPPLIGCLAEYLTLRGGLLLVNALALLMCALAPSVNVRHGSRVRAKKASPTELPTAST